MMELRISRRMSGVPPIPPIPLEETSEASSIVPGIKSMLALAVALTTH